ncbi:hypothetical protein LZ339_26945, partial [Serratia marcescens]
APPGAGVTERKLFALYTRQNAFFSYFFIKISLCLCRLILKIPIAKIALAPFTRIALDGSATPCTMP